MVPLEVDALLEVKLILDQEHIERLLDEEPEPEEMVEIHWVVVLEEMVELEYVDTEDEDDEDDMLLDELLVIDEVDDDDIMQALDTRVLTTIDEVEDELGIELTELANLELTDVNELCLYVIQKMEVMVSKELLEEMNVMNVIDTVYINLHLIENSCQHNGNFLQQNSKNI